MAMPDLEDPQDEWEVEEVRDKQRIKGVLHYLVKWAGWPSEYNSYEPASHLVSAPKAVADYERKRKKAKAVGKAVTTDDGDRAASSGDEPAPRKRTRRV
jgi:hypothetical protein